MMNKLTLSLRNFQSISEGELTFQTGLNFIIGQSNSGKSATFRALKACLLNPAGSQRFIKKGNNKSEVILKYNGQEIQWERTPKESNYIINGEPYFKTGRSNAFKIIENDTGFNQDVNGTIMNIEEELQLPFPFGLNGSDLFKLFENVFCISDSAVILKSAKEYEKGVEVDINSLDLEEQKVSVKIKALEEFKKYVDVEKLLSYKSTLEALSKRLNILNDGKEVIELAVKLNNSDFQISEKEFLDLYSLYSSLVKCKELLIKTKRLHELSKAFQEIPELLVPDLNRYKELKELRTTLASLKRLKQLVLREEEFKDKMKELNNLLEIKKFITSFKEEVQKLKTKGREEEDKVRGIEERLKEFKICPLCHKPLE